MAVAGKLRVGFVGLGKLGMPVAVALASLGHEVAGYDIDPNRMRKEHPFKESGAPLADTFDEALAYAHNLTFADLAVLREGAQVIMIAVPTPHEPAFEGITPLPPSRKPFDYTALEASLRAVTEGVGRVASSPLLVCVISTVLPGTMRRLLDHMTLPPNVHVAYTPQFIAMGTTLADFLKPEFILAGRSAADDSDDGPDLVDHMLADLFDGIEAPILPMSYESAELTKVAYNTFISAKLAVTNTIMEVAHAIPYCNIDDVTNALKKARNRITSGAYMTAGMGDGGACHPRDNIAMSWLARRLGLRFDIFDSVMMARQKQAEWMVSIITKEYDAAERHVPLRIPRVLLLGYSYKPDTNLTVGSHALLMLTMLMLDDRFRGVRAPNEPPRLVARDPIIDGVPTPEFLNQFDVIFIGCNHSGVEGYAFPAHAVVIDPFRIVPVPKSDRGNYRVVQLGIGRRLG